MILRVPQRVFDRLFDESLITLMGLPPKDPPDDDENEEGEEDDDEEDDEPAVIREPDEC
ncbi:MAG: hypothetical protein WAR76_15060 [Xanthobacteraceae bacterium]|jgi:hypothetical protein